MKEFEYSFTVDSVIPYHDFCAKNSDQTVEVTQMRRKVYKNGSSTIARLTWEVDPQNKKLFYIDFKEDSKDSDLVKHVRESKKMILSEDRCAAVERLLAKLEYHLTADLDKQRSSYWIADVRVDIDTYHLPTKAFVIELEGEPGVTKRLYTRMKKAIAGSY